VQAIAKLYFRTGQISVRYSNSVCTGRCGEVMNERIQKLIEQAHEQKPYMVFDPRTCNLIQLERSGELIYHNVFNPEKFAELLIKECAETLKKDMELAHIQLIPLDFKMYANGRLQRTIEEHFGIEE
jgi:hypothetical protein